MQGLLQKIRDMELELEINTEEIKNLEKSNEKLSMLNQKLKMELEILKMERDKTKMEPQK